MALILISSCTPPTKLTYISFGDDMIYAESNVVIRYQNRLDIKSTFKELGVILVEGLEEPDIDEIRLLAAQKGADGLYKYSPSTK